MMSDLAEVASQIVCMVLAKGPPIGLMPTSKSFQTLESPQMVDLSSKRIWLSQLNLECKFFPSCWYFLSNDAPSSYFSRYALEEVYLKSPKYAKYINKDLLQKYYPIGGVRIEDDLLITEDGYENLTTTPKGEEALKIINEGKEQEEEERQANKRVAESRKQKKTWFW